MGGSMYPIVPGHEFIGKVVEVGPKVTRVKVGDTAGIGVLSDSCLDCDACNAYEENYCLKGHCHTYNSERKYDCVPGNKAQQNFGGYSGSHCLHEHFVYKIPDEIPMEVAGPILCAGITMYDPLRHWGATKEGNYMTIGIVGIGGLGTMGIKLAKALGHRVVAISTSPSKEATAKEKGADAFVVSTDPASLKAEEGQLDLILNTISVEHEASFYLPLLRHGGTVVELGVLDIKHHINQMTLLPQRKSIAGSLIGGTKATEELLELCAKHKVFPDVKVVEASQLNEIYDTLNLTKNADGTRFVLDIEKSLTN